MFSINLIDYPDDSDFDDEEIGSKQELPVKLESCRSIADDGSAPCEIIDRSPSDNEDDSLVVEIDDNMEELKNLEDPVTNNDNSQSKSRKLSGAWKSSNSLDYIAEVDNYNMAIKFDDIYDDPSLFDDDDEDDDDEMLEMEITEEQLRKLIDIPLLSSHLLDEKPKFSPNISDALLHLPSYGQDLRFCKDHLSKLASKNQNFKQGENVGEVDTLSIEDKEIKELSEIKKLKKDFYNKSCDKKSDILIQKLVSRDKSKLNTKEKDQPNILSCQQYFDNNSSNLQLKNESGLNLRNDLSNKCDIKTGQIKIFDTFKELNDHNKNISSNLSLNICCQLDVEMHALIESFFAEKNKTLNKVYVEKMIRKFIHYDDSSVVKLFSQFVSKLFSYKDQAYAGSIMFCLRRVSIELIINLNKKNLNKYVEDILDLIFLHKVHFTSALRIEFVRAVVKALLIQQKISKLKAFLEITNYFEPKSELCEKASISENPTVIKIRNLIHAFDEIYSYLIIQFSTAYRNAYIFLPDKLIFLTVKIFSLIKNLVNNVWNYTLEKQVSINFPLLSSHILNYILRNGLDFVTSIISYYIKEDVFVDAIGDNLELVRKIICYLVSTSQLQKHYLPLEFKVLDLGIHLGIYPKIKPFTEDFVNIIHLLGTLYQSEIELIIRQCVIFGDNYFATHQTVVSLEWKIKIVECFDIRKFMIEVLEPVLRFYNSLTYHYPSNDGVVIINQKNFFSYQGSNVNEERAYEQNYDLNFVPKETENRCDDYAVKEPLHSYFVNEFQDRNYRDATIYNSITKEKHNNCVWHNSGGYEQFIENEAKPSSTDKVSPIFSSKSTKKNDTNISENDQFNKIILLPTPIIGFERIGQPKNCDKNFFDTAIEQFRDADERRHQHKPDFCNEKTIHPSNKIKEKMDHVKNISVDSYSNLNNIIEDDKYKMAKIVPNLMDFNRFMEPVVSLKIINPLLVQNTISQSLMDTGISSLRNHIFQTVQTHIAIHVSNNHISPMKANILCNQFTNMCLDWLCRNDRKYDYLVHSNFMEYIDNKVNLTVNCNNMKFNSY